MYSLAYQGPWIENTRQDKEKEEKRKNKTKEKKKRNANTWLNVCFFTSFYLFFVFVLFCFVFIWPSVIGDVCGGCVCVLVFLCIKINQYIYIDICAEGSQWDTYLLTFSQMILILSLSKWRWWRMSLSIYAVIVADVNRSTLALINVLLSLPSSLNSGRNLPLWKICNMQINWVVYILKVVSELQKTISNGNAFWICENVSQKDCETNYSDFFLDVWFWFLPEL